MAPPGARPRIGEYAGRGPLQAWVRVAAVRAALDLLRAGGARGGGEVEPEDLAADVVSPEVDYVKERYRPQFKAAFQDALRALDSEQRNVLRLHVVEGLNIDEIGALFKVHRSTVARWIAAARQQVLAGARNRLRVELGPSAPASSTRWPASCAASSISAWRRSWGNRAARSFLRQPAPASVFLSRGMTMERKSRLGMQDHAGARRAGLWGASLLPRPARGAARSPSTARRARSSTAPATRASASAPRRWRRRARRRPRPSGAWRRPSNVDGPARQRALEALARAGTSDAQAAMRAALSSPARARTRPTRCWWRASSGVGAPTFETLSFLAETRAQALAAGRDRARRGRQRRPRHRLQPPPERARLDPLAPGALAHRAKALARSHDDEHDEHVTGCSSGRTSCASGWARRHGLGVEGDAIGPGLRARWWSSASCPRSPATTSSCACSSRGAPVGVAAPPATSCGSRVRRATRASATWRWSGCTAATSLDDDGTRDRAGAPSPGLAAYVAREVCRALAYVHGSPTRTGGRCSSSIATCRRRT